jgi:hypothetical protein
MKKSRVYLSAMLCLAFFIIAGAMVIQAKIVDSDFTGVWTIKYDGASGKITINPDGKGYFTDSAGTNDTLISIVLKGHKGVFRTEGSGLEFTGYMFKGKGEMAGTFNRDNSTFGWYGTKTGNISTDTPDTEGPKGEISLTTSKPQYALGETVEFFLGNTKTTPLDLHGNYYIIEYRVGNVGKEFFTSLKDGFANPILDPGVKKKLTWDQWDNERKNAAWNGPWRIKFYIPALGSAPLITTFKIK